MESFGYSTAPRIPPGLGMVHWSCWMTLGPAWLKRPQDSFKIASSWLSWANLGPTWGQVGSKLAQVGLMLGPSWLQVGSSWAQVGPRICPWSVQEGLPVRSKRVLGGSRWLQELKRLSGPLQGPIFDRFLIDFWWFWDLFWDVFLIIFWFFWELIFNHFGVKFYS